MFSVQDSSTVFTLTDAAADKVKVLIEAEGNPDLFLRVAVRPGGCSGCLLYTSPSPRDRQKSRMPSSA